MAIALCCSLPRPAAALSLLDADGNPREELLQVGRVLGLGWGSTARSINAYAQAHLLRPPHRERHRMANSPYENRWDDLQPALEALGMLQAVDPPPGHHDHLLLMGQTIPMMRGQLEFIRRRREISFGRVTFLSGRRPIDPAIDGPDRLTSLAKDEGEAAQMLLDEYFPGDGRTSTVAVPMHPDGRRPNTRDTVRAWLAEGPEPSSVLVVSTNPFIPYQLETVRGELARAWPEGSYRLAICGDDVHRLYRRGNRVAILLDCLARQLYTELTYRGELD
jgi:hypothetical protein